MRLKPNTILLADAYKYTHWLQLPKGTTFIEGYIESRGTKLNISYQRFFGLQGFIKDYLKGKVIKKWMITEAADLLGEMFGTHAYFNKEGFLKLLDKHGGRLPIKIRAVKEGTKVPLHNVMVIVENTDPEFPWLTMWIETMLLRAVWYPTTVCTISSAVKDIEREFAAICGAKDNIFFLNDFGARGVSSHESAELGGAAHLVNYFGTDTVEAVRWAKARYGKMATGYSVIATEHSTTTIYLKDGETDAYRNMLTVAPKNAIVSIVIDSYNPINAVQNILGGTLKPMIMERTAPTVFRPDSGDPVEMSFQIVELLWNIFGGTVNEKGYRVLDNHVRIIYGDGINLDSIRQILQKFVDNKYSIENIVFGMGGKLLQAVDRDTFQYACKACFAIVDGIGRDIFKQPSSDKMKNSKKGELKLIIKDGQFDTVNVQVMPDLKCNLFTIFENGMLKKQYSFDEVRTA